jgi:peptide chain release factor 1
MNGQIPLENKVVKIVINKDKPPRELIYSLTKKDFVVQTFRGSGAGGQNRNKRDTAVRIIHQASGARGESCEERSQAQNKKTAFRRLIASGKFKLWHAKVCYEFSKKKTVEQEVDEWMVPKFIKTEVKGPTGKWITASEEDLKKENLYNGN